MRRMFESLQKYGEYRKSGHYGPHADTKRVWRHGRFAPAAVAAALLVITTGGATAAQAISLVEYAMANEVGNQTTTAPTFSSAGVTGVAMTRGSGLNPQLGAGSMNSSGWDDLNVNDFYSFGFNVSPGSSVFVDSLQLSTRSSATAPGFVNVLYTVDGGPETLLATLTQPNAQFLDSALTFSTPVSVNSSFRIVLRAANSTASNGGTVGSVGTLRISDYNNGTAFQPVTLLGRITSNAAAPEPGSLLLGATVLIPLAGMIRRRRK